MENPKIFFFIFFNFFRFLQGSTPAFSPPPKRAEATHNFSILAHSNSLYKWFWTHFGIFLKKISKKMKNSKKTKAKKTKICASHNFSFWHNQTANTSDFGHILELIWKKIQKIEKLCFAQFSVFGKKWTKIFKNFSANVQVTPAHARARPKRQKSKNPGSKRPRAKLLCYHRCCCCCSACMYLGHLHMYLAFWYHQHGWIQWLQIRTAGKKERPRNLILPFEKNLMKFLDFLNLILKK